MLGPCSCAIGKYPLYPSTATAKPTISPIPITEPEPFDLSSGFLVS